MQASAATAHLVPEVRARCKSHDNDTARMTDTFMDRLNAALEGRFPDDQRLLMVRPYQSGQETVGSELILVRNWFEVLKERVGN